MPTEEAKTKETPMFEEFGTRELYHAAFLYYHGIQVLRAERYSADRCIFYFRHEDRIEELTAEWMNSKKDYSLGLVNWELFRKSLSDMKTLINLKYPQRVKSEPDR